MTHADYSALRRGYGTDADREAALDTADYCHECGSIVCDEDDRVISVDGELLCTKCGDALEPCFACGVPLLDAEIVRAEGEVFCEAHAPGEVE